MKSGKVRWQTYVRVGLSEDGQVDSEFEEMDWCSI